MARPKLAGSNDTADHGMAVRKRQHPEERQKVHCLSTGLTLSLHEDLGVPRHCTIVFRRSTAPRPPRCSAPLHVRELRCASLRQQLARPLPSSTASASICRARPPLLHHAALPHAPEIAEPLSHLAPRLSILALLPCWDPDAHNARLRQGKVLALASHVQRLQEQLEEMQLERTHNRAQLATLSQYTGCPVSSLGGSSEHSKLDCGARLIEDETRPVHGIDSPQLATQPDSITLVSLVACESKPRCEPCTMDAALDACTLDLMVGHYCAAWRTSC